jgi:uncharacterized protein YodC (DUF2158 family)
MRGDPMARQFQPGDVVWLKDEQATKMVVVRYDENGEVDCAWGPPARRERWSFPEFMLTHASSSPILVPMCG